MRRITLLGVLALSSALLPAMSHAAGLISVINRAGISPDGNVAGATTDLIIDLDKSLDPAVLGYPLPAGCSVRVTLPPAFQWSGLPVRNALTPGCAPGTPFACTTGVFLQGWPQRPIVPAALYSLETKRTNTLVFTANSDVGAPHMAPAPGPGLKQVHIISGYINPERPGHYPIRVKIKGPGCPTRAGTGHVQIVPSIEPSINVVSAPATMGASTIFQTTGPGQAAPLPWEFVLWDENGAPLEDVTVQMIHADYALLLQGFTPVGTLRIDSPAGSIGHHVTDIATSAPGAPAPLKGIPAGRLAIAFTAGSAIGRYTTTIAMNGGDSIEMVVTTTP